MVGAAVRGISKILKKSGKKARRGTPTKAGLMARRNMLRGETTAEKYKKILGPTPKPTKKKPIISKFEAGVGVGGTGVLATQGYLKFLEAEANATKKEAKAKETKEKLKEATEKHKKKTKEKRKKYGKHHG